MPTNYRPESFVSCLNETKWDDDSTMTRQKSWFMSQCSTMGWRQYYDKPESLVSCLNETKWDDDSTMTRQKSWFMSQCNTMGWRQHQDLTESLVSCLNATPWDDGSNRTWQKAWFHVSMQHHGMTAAIGLDRKLGFNSQCNTLGWRQQYDKSENMSSCLLKKIRFKFPHNFGICYCQKNLTTRVRRAV